MDQLFDGWNYVPPGPVQTVAEMIGGPADGSFTDIGSVEELPDHIEVLGTDFVHYYALTRKHRSWVFVYVASDIRSRR